MKNSLNTWNENFHFQLVYDKDPDALSLMGQYKQKGLTANTWIHDNEGKRWLPLEIAIKARNIAVTQWMFDNDFASNLSDEQKAKVIKTAILYRHNLSNEPLKSFVETVEVNTIFSHVLIHKRLVSKLCTRAQRNAYREAAYITLKRLSPLVSQLSDQNYLFILTSAFEKVETVYYWVERLCREDKSFLTEALINNRLMQFWMRHNTEHHFYSLLSLADNRLRMLIEQKLQKRKQPSLLDRKRWMMFATSHHLLHKSTNEYLRDYHRTWTLKHSEENWVNDAKKRMIQVARNYVRTENGKEIVKPSFEKKQPTMTEVCQRQFPYLSEPEIAKIILEKHCEAEGQVNQPLSSN